MKNNLITERDRLIRYGSYLATKVFEKERYKLGRINWILFTRYGIEPVIKTPPPPVAGNEIWKRTPQK